MNTFYRSIGGLFATLLSLAMLFFVVGTASAHATYPAHAKVLSATPAIGSTITQAPTTVTVECAENINPNPKLSNLFVYNSKGDLISQGNAKVSLNKPTEMSVTIKPSGDGIYVVQWITVSAEDGDPDQGAFGFTVKTSVVATPTATNSGATSPTTSGIPLWVPILVGIVALVIGLGAGLAIGRSRTKTSSLSAMRQQVAAQQREDVTPTKRP